MNEALSYKDIVLYPQYSEIKSRDDVNTSINFLGYSFKSPVVPANMACCINFKNAEILAKNGYFYILHRFYDYTLDVIPWLSKNKNSFPLSVSVGVKECDYDFLQDLSELDFAIDFITVDVAHGDHISVKEICAYFHSLNWIRKPKLIVGNFGSSEGANRAIEWGADAVKVGLSMGAACTTYNTTGVGTPMYSIVNEVFLECDIPIIADGQIREIGDIAKAIHAGANIIMVGSMFAACEDSPAEFNFYKTHKIFYGSASSKNKGFDKYIEGKESLLESNKMTTIEFLGKISEGLRSTMSYAGVSNIYNITKMEAKRRYV